MPLRTKRLAEEGSPVAAILLFWYVLAAVVEFSPALGSTVADAGVAMAALYVAVRGAALAPDAPALETGEVRIVLYENAHAALSAGLWFVGAAVAYAVHQSYVYHELVGAIADALAGAGLGVVGVYAVAVGVATLGGRFRGDSVGRADVADSDDETPADD